MNQNGSPVSGFPQTWCTYGGLTGTINVSNGAPTGKCSTNGNNVPPVVGNPEAIVLEQPPSRLRATRYLPALCTGCVVRELRRARQGFGEDPAVKVDARKLADLLRTGMLRPVYHGENGLRTLREFGRSYQTISKDLTRVMNRLKALYRGWGIPCAGTQVYAPRYREEWLSKIVQGGGAAQSGATLSTVTGVNPWWTQGPSVATAA